MRLEILMATNVSLVVFRAVTEYEFMGEMSTLRWVIGDSPEDESGVFYWNLVIHTAPNSRKPPFWYVSIVEILLVWDFPVKAFVGLVSATSICRVADSSVHNHTARTSCAHSAWPRGTEKSAEREAAAGGPVKADARRGEGYILRRPRRCCLEAHLKVTHNTPVFFFGCFNHPSFSKSSVRIFH